MQILSGLYSQHQKQHVAHHGDTYTTPEGFVTVYLWPVLFHDGTPDTNAVLRQAPNGDCFEKSDLERADYVIPLDNVNHTGYFTRDFHAY